jgi:hypothetical protein
VQTPFYADARQMANSLLSRIYPGGNVSDSLYPAIIKHVALGPGPRPVPATTKCEVSNPPSVLDWTAAFVQTKYPGTSWMDARKAVMATLAQQREHGEDSFSELQKAIWQAWQVNASAAEAGV